jgi:UPF0176 protein
MSANCIVTTFYKFIELDNLPEIRLQLIKICNQHQIKGTILLAPEGVNATIAASRQGMDTFYQFMKANPLFNDVVFRESIFPYQPFKRMKVRLKKEIIRFKVDDLDLSQNGEYLSPDEWDEMLKDPKVKIIDTRNDYEVSFGTFKNATNPETRYFSEFPAWADKNINYNDKDQPILMFCTGGVRCEKSTAYLKKKGLRKVYHLEGGILEYLRQTKNKNNNWQGNCFVFDDRIAVDAHMKGLIQENNSPLAEIELSKRANG